MTLKNPYNMVPRMREGNMLSLCSLVIMTVFMILFLQRYVKIVNEGKVDCNNLITTKVRAADYDDTDDDYLMQGQQPPLYQPSAEESLIMKNMDYWGWNETNETLINSPCEIFKVDLYGNKGLSQSLQTYITELTEYGRLVSEFTAVPDIRFPNGNRSKVSRKYRQKDEICDQLKLHPKGLAGIFPNKHLSYLSRNTKQGTTAVEYLEPLLPPLRHPKFCFDSQNLFNMGYLIHDFEDLCRRQIRNPASRNVFIDMGASYEFSSDDDLGGLSIYLMNLFAKFGFPFDHIYGYEMKQIDPRRMYTLLPERYHSAFHWINLPVTPESPDKFDNPLRLILDNFHEDDLIIVKLDIDTPSVEMAFIQQMLQSQDDPNSLQYQKYSKLIDHFYFEQHVVLKDLLPWWGWGDVNGSVSMSLQLFQQLREQGIGAHYWP